MNTMVMGKYIYAVVDETGEQTYGPIGLNGGIVYTLSHGSVAAVVARIAADNTVLPPLPEDRFLCGFSHIFAGGYAAGYYSYKWAEVLSADAFAAFEEAGLDNAEAVACTGRRFRDTVLALGGSRNPAEVFTAFRSRAPSTAALLRHNGLRPLG